MPGHYHIPALYNAAMKISVQSHTHFYPYIQNYDILNALLECIKF